MSEIEALLQRAKRYCVYRERCLKETRHKLKEFGANSAVAEEIISILIISGFLNEQRFAQFFCFGKFRHNSWGRTRIVRELEKREVSQQCIAMGLKEISEEDYINELRRLVSLKVKEKKRETQIIKRNKVAQYCIRKGFESELVWAEVSKQIS